MSDSIHAMPVQLIGDRSMIDAVSGAASAASIDVSPLALSTADQRFGVAEVAAILALVHTGVQIANLLIDAYKKLRQPRQVVLRTPKGSVTIDVGEATSADEIVQKLKDIGIR